MKSYKKSSFHKLYLIDVEKKEIIDLNEEHMDGVVEKFNSKRFLWSNAHDCFPCGGFRCGSFPCSGCKKVFTTKFSLKRHFKTFHTVPKCCKYCNARKLHTTPENTETPQTSAEKSVDQKRKVSDMTPNVENETLKKPKWTQGQKQYSCQACDKSFTQSHNLNTHILKVHRGQKQYYCQACEKKYKYKKNLKIHILTVHRGQKPYYCQACDKSYTQSSSLKTHILTFHRGQKYYCQACDKSYTRSHTLKTHMQKCGHTHIQKVHEELKLPQSSAGIKNEFTPDEVDRMTPNVENETLKKPKWTRGQKRKKSMPQGKIFKQIHLEALLDALNSEFGL